MKIINKRFLKLAQSMFNFYTIKELQLRMKIKYSKQIINIASPDVAAVVVSTNTSKKKKKCFLVNNKVTITTNSFLNQHRMLSEKQLLLSPKIFEHYMLKE